jgi:hypothetical protein
MERAVKMPDSGHERASKMLDAGDDRGVFASTSLPAHLTRGAIGFGLLGAAVALTPSHGPAALLLAPPGLVALRGCPTCWLAGLAQTISAGRLRRTCTESGCALAPAVAGGTARAADEIGGTRTNGIPREGTKSTRSRAA